MRYDDLFLLAARQAGYFTVEQAHEFGISSRMVLHHASTGRFLRIARGVYRFRDFPDPYSDLPVAWLAVGRLTEGRAIVSHESALYLHDLGDVLPRAVDVMVDRSDRRIRVPSYPVIRLHTTLAWPNERDVESMGGALVTSATRSLVDCLIAHVEGQQVMQAYREARSRGWTTDELLLAEGETHGPSALSRVRTLLAEAACTLVKER
jgi:predicted transcriptional regulator of viral defense system